MENKVILISTLEEMEKAFSTIIDELRQKPVKKPERKRLSRAQAAKFCGMSYHTFGIHVRAGRFIERGMGRKRFFYEDELIQALNEKKR
jgi:hypothetical protein